MGKLTPEQILADPSRCGYYGYRNKAGQPCGEPVILGTKRGRIHSGVPVAKLKAQGQVVVELRNWGLNEVEVRDPGETLLRLVTQSANRVELYSGLLQQAYDAAERLQAAHAAERLVVETENYDDGPPKPDVQTATEDLKRIFNTGGIAALVGYQYDATKDGDIYATNEAIRGLAKLEADERDRCASFAAKAVAAGLAERMVRLAERQGQLMAQLVLRVAERLGLSDAQRAELPAAIEAEVISMTEGVAA